MALKRFEIAPLLELQADLESGFVKSSDSWVMRDITEVCKPYHKYWYYINKDWAVPFSFNEQRQISWAYRAVMDKKDAMLRGIADKLEGKQMETKKDLAFNQLHSTLGTHNKHAIKIAGAGICLQCHYHGNFDEFEYMADDTAMCPVCNVDLVIPDTGTKRFIKKMTKRFFT